MAHTAGQRDGLNYNKPHIVPIQVNRQTTGRSMDSLDSPPTNSVLGQNTFHGGTLNRHQTRNKVPYHQLRGDDDLAGSQSADEVETIKRPSAIVSPRISVRNKPAVRTMSKPIIRRSSRELTPTADIMKLEAETSYTGTLTRKSTYHDQKTPVIVNSPVVPDLKPDGPTKEILYATPNKGKRAPPPPPKRTNSIKNDSLQCHIDSTSSVASPVHATPQSSSADTSVQQPVVHQQEQRAFTSCVSAMSQRFISETTTATTPSTLSSVPRDDSMQSLPDAPNNDYSPSQNEDFPPPPPPINAKPAGHKDLNNVLQELQAFRTKDTRTNTINRAASSAVDGGNSKQTSYSVGRTEPGGHMESGVSSASTDTLPFANENVGTIKQRAAPNKPSIVSVTEPSQSAADNFDTVSTARTVDLNQMMFEDGTATVQRRRPPPPDLQSTPVSGSPHMAQVQPNAHRGKFVR